MANNDNLLDLRAQLEALAADMARIAQSVNNTNERLLNIENAIAVLQQPLHAAHGARVDADGQNQRSPNFPRANHVDFPKFDGTDVLHWIFRAEQFFDYYETPEDQRISLASIHFEKEVVPWFQMMQRTFPFNSWTVLSRALETQFGPSAFDCPRSDLFKLVQTNTVQKYCLEFSALANRSYGISPDAMVDCFIGGLKSEIRKEVIAQNPTDLMRAFALAKLYEDKAEIKPKPSSWQPRPLHNPCPLNFVSSPTSSTLPKQPPLLQLPPPKTPPTSQRQFNIRKLPAADMQRRREQGLCFACDEKFSFRHKCPNKRMSLLQVEDEAEEVYFDTADDTETTQVTEEGSENPRQVYFNALHNEHRARSTTRRSRSISSSSTTHRYDVFVSFRGKDTRNNFSDHLFAAFQREDIIAFRDDRNLKQGEHISTELIQAIEGSQVWIVVFSKNYAYSSWCLQELAKIVDCKKVTGQRVLPVFYDVSPSEVRKQRGGYGKAFVEHKKRFKQDLGMVQRWREALEQVADLAGWNVKNRSQYGEIEKIVERVKSILGYKLSSLDGLVGIHSRVEQLEKFLAFKSNDDVRVVGTCGMGGIGKTTLARVVYDKNFHQYGASCFIDDVSKVYHNDGPIAAQKQLIWRNVEENQEIYSISEANYLIRTRLRYLKTLIVLDNVDEVEILEKLGLIRDSLGAGSRVNVISGDRNILNEYGVDAIYDAQLLNLDEAHQLFCRKAFKNDYIMGFDDNSREYKELVDLAIKSAQCLPLAIEVLGSFLCGRSIFEWRSALARLKDNPNKEIMDVLQISFDGLELMEKEIFLDIACFFNGRNEKYVKRALDCCGFHPDIGIRVLISLNLDHCRQLASLFDEFPLCTDLPVPKELVYWKNKKARAGLHIFNCPKLVGMEGWSSIAISWMIQVLKVHKETSSAITVVIPGTEIPSWFSCQSVGCRMKIELFPYVHDCNWIGLVICAAFVTKCTPDNSIMQTCCGLCVGGRFVAKSAKTYGVMVESSVRHLYLFYLTRQELIDIIECRGAHHVFFEFMVYAEGTSESSNPVEIVLHEVKHGGMCNVFKQDLEERNSDK